MEPAVAEIVRVLRGSRKYGALCTETLERVARWAALRQRTPRAAARAARSKLHQVYGAYLASGHWRVLERVQAEMEAVALPVGTAPSQADEIRDCARRVLSLHASTSERLAFQEQLYPRLLRGLRPAHGALRVLDLACGLHPFALPWMGLPVGSEYVAWDIDLRLVAAINRFLDLLGQRGRAEARDLLCGPRALERSERGKRGERAADDPQVYREADLVLILKTLPCLERQERDAGVRLLSGLRAQRVVVSYPARSLGGREKGMVATYDRQVHGLAEILGAQVERLEYPTETFHLFTWP
ncbi:MAG: hypothetical protein KAY32_07420 [Candidatus Eisenbacteria sp.]|nr:hypothetical protein [Candidatus Eisenbacteria bacterium]